MKWVKRSLLGLLTVIVLIFVLLIGGLLWFNIPTNGSGMAAEAVCSATFVAGRGQDQDVFAQDVLPASPAFKVISTSIDEQNHTVTAKFLGMFERHASLVNKRGCVLDLPADPTAVPYTVPPANPAQWPVGDAAVPPAQWPSGVNATGLNQVLDNYMQGQGNPDGANPRGIAIVQNGKLLAERNATNFPVNTGLHGWSMTKTVAMMLIYKRAQETGFDLNRRVIDVFTPGRTPPWVEQWKSDDRRNITVADLAFMRSGLDIGEGYEPWGSVVQMLNGEPNMAQWSAEHSLGHPPATYWEYASGSSNILAQVAMMAMFNTDEEYWNYSKQALFDPIGASSASLATDTSGTWVGSSYLWADVGDWAKFGQVMLADGKWEGKDVLPPGWLNLATQKAMPDGEGNGYGWQTWLDGVPVNGDCAKYPGVPADTISMEGHWGQLVAMVPSRNAVLVRLGWNMSSSSFDSCQFVSDVLADLPKS